MGLQHIDFAVVARVALAQIEHLLARWLPGGRTESGEYKVTNPTRSDKSVGSFSVCVSGQRAGCWADFATDDAGKDLISLYAYLNGCRNQAEAARAVAAQCGLAERDFVTMEQGGQALSSSHSPASGRGGRSEARSEGAALAGSGGAHSASTKADAGAPAKKRGNWVAVTPVPEFARDKFPRAHFHRGEPQTRWAYRNASGELLGFTCRFETSDGGKEVLPLVFARHADTGEQKWTWVQWPEPRPLFLTGSPDASRVAVVVEGEKCAEAASQALSAGGVDGFDVYSWSGGCKAVDKADWAQLAGYAKVVLWADRDNQKFKDSDEFLPDFAEDGRAQPGTKAMAMIAEKLRALGVPDVSMVNLPAVSEVKDGWDVADFVDELRVEAGLSPEVVAQAVVQFLGSTHTDWVVSKKGVSASELSTPNQSPRGVRRPQSVSRETKFTGDLAEYERLQYLFRRTDKGAIKQVRENVFYALDTLSEWRGVIAFDEFANRTVKTRVTPFGAPVGEWTNSDDLELGLWLSEQVDFVGANDQAIMQGVALAAHKNRIHPPRDYLNSLKWDGTGRLEFWLKKVFEAVELNGHKVLSKPADDDGSGEADGNEYLKRVGEKFMIGAVARIFEPGCKFDNMLVLEGKQGRGKSTAIRILFGDWFSDTQLELQNKDAYAQLDGIWGYEIGEMDAFSRAEATRVKAFVTSQVDRYRAAFERRPESHARSTVFIGTTNQDEYLKDPTGARRFWPVRVSEDVNFDALRAERDQLWAEAVARYRAGEKWHVTPQEQEDYFAAEQKAREVPDPWFDAIEDWLQTEQASAYQYEAYGYRIIDVLKGAVGFHVERAAPTRQESQRVASILRQLGYERYRESTGKRGYRYKLVSEQKAQASA